MVRKGARQDASGVLDQTGLATTYGPDPVIVIVTSRCPRQDLLAVLFYSGAAHRAILYKGTLRAISPQLRRIALSVVHSFLPPLFTGLPVEKNQIIESMGGERGSKWQRDCVAKAVPWENRRIRILRVITIATEVG